MVIDKITEVLLPASGFEVSFSVLPPPTIRKKVRYKWKITTLGTVKRPNERLGFLA